MCGIYVSVGFPPERQRLRMIAHRGPDGEGWEEHATPAGTLCLGHRRLAIIDRTDEAAQPMAWAGGRYHLVFNGEIYNYLELQQRLRGLGFPTTTRSDSEVILAGYAAWGDDVVAHLRGMFAFVLYDREAKRLLVARDRFGIKPLYLATSHDGLAFGSEIKQLLGLEGVSTRANRDRVYDFVVRGLADHTDETLFADVRQLSAGHLLTIDLADRQSWQAPVPRSYYALPAPGSISMSESEAAGAFSERFDDAIRLHLRADVPVGACLSGGLDSSSIVCVMAKQLAEGGASDRLNTFSARFHGHSVDEGRYMAAVTQATGAQAHDVAVDATGLIALAEKATWHQDEPFMGTSILAQWRVFEAAAAAGVPVMLDGQGADELLAGYHYAFGLHLRSLARQHRWREVALTRWAQHRDAGAALLPSPRSLLRPLLTPRLRKAAAFVLGRNKDPMGWVSAPSGRAYDIEQAALQRAGHLPVEGLGDLCVAQLKTMILPRLLHWEDRNSMAHSIEARVPFLDHPLVELCIGLGDEHKIVDGETKRVLRRAMAGTLPQQVLDRRDKLGFTTPEAAWLCGPAADAVRHEVEETLVRFPELFDAPRARAAVDEGLRGTGELSHAIWSLVNLGMWGRTFDVSW